MGTHPINFNLEGLLETLKSTLYDERDAAIRELLSNAQDACVRRQQEDSNFTTPRIEVSTDGKSAFSVIDNGCGMTAEELHQFFATVGASMASSIPASNTSLIGHSGIGVLIIMMVAEQIEVTTKSFKPDSSSLRWIYSGGDTYELMPVSSSPVGTKVITQLKEEYRYLASDSHLSEAINRFAEQLTVPVDFVRSQLHQSTSAVHRPLSKPAPPPGPNTDSEGDLAGWWDPDKISNDESVGVIRLDLNGSWSVADFGKWLTTLDSSYMRIRAFFATPPEMCGRSMRTLYDRERPLDILLREVALKSRELRLSSIQLASPGFVELIGNLNPIKVIADFITSWRHENTVREQNQRQAGLELKKLLADRSAELIRAAPHRELVFRFIQYAMDEPQHELKPIASDTRLTKVSWHLLDDGTSRPANPDN